MLQKIHMVECDVMNGIKAQKCAGVYGKHNLRPQAKSQWLPTYVRIKIGASLMRRRTTFSFNKLIIIF